MHFSKLFKKILEKSQKIQFQKYNSSRKKIKNEVTKKY